MAATRLLRMPTPNLGLALSHEILSNPAVSSIVMSRPRTVLMCLNKVGLSSDNPPGGGGGGRKPVAAPATGRASACVLVSEPKTDKVVDLGLLLAYVADAMSHWRKFITKQRSWGLHIQMFVEKAITDCRFFTLLATAGSLLGSVLCFVEGCFLVLVSYLQYFHAISQMSEQGQVVLLLIQAIDMFLMGTAMLIFAMALHVMFVGQNNLTGKGSHHSDSTLSRNFNLKKLRSWIGIDESAMQAKSKIGHALILILHIQVLDKFKTIPVTNGMDLACFAGAIFLSSASIFLLSRVSVARAEAKRYIGRN